MTENEVTFYSTRKPNIELRGIIHEPEEEGVKMAVVLCPPDPLEGGSMDVALIKNIAENLCKNGVIAIRFDYGGVGLSGGIFTNGKEEPRDVEAAANFMSNHNNVNPERVSLIGWSFGARMALSALAAGVPVYSCVAIAPPLEEFDWKSLASAVGAKSKTIRYYLMGAKDQYCKVDTLMTFANLVSADDKKNVEVLYGTDHFLQGREAEVTNLVVERIIPHQ